MFACVVGESKVVNRGEIIAVDVLEGVFLLIALGVCVGEVDLSSVFNGACDVENSFPVVGV